MFSLSIYRSGRPSTYSPNLNPIERLWKAIKGKLAQQGFIQNAAHLNQLIDEAFDIAFQSLSFAKNGLMTSGMWFSGKRR